MGQQLIATCTLVIIPNPTRAGMPNALIENVITHPGQRNAGHGKAILTKAVELACAANC
ncbi:GNAT family N-acetyltransferase [Pseudomonas sp. DWP3-1-2]|uniref:GNAT family N-acetyltransferase n=1 Tax=Pseudomonas sp. DWP3-1-2 TaxID=2804645 RepID=UPI003CFB499D